MRSWRCPAVLALGLVGLAGSACQEDGTVAALLGRVAPAPDATLSLSAPGTDRVDAELVSKVAYQLLTAEQRQAQELPLPAGQRAQRCADDRLRSLDELDRTLTLVSRDRRAEQRYVLPLRLRQPLTTAELSDIRRRHAAGDDTQQRYRLRFATTEAARSALGELERLNRRPLIGVYHITHYRAPRWIRKPDKLRPEWVAGQLHARFVVYDLREQQPICQTQLAVENDTREASLRVRLRSDTRERLIVELGQTLRRKSAEALAKLSEVLRLPPEGEAP